MLQLEVLIIGGSYRGESALGLGTEVCYTNHFYQTITQSDHSASNCL